MTTIKIAGQDVELQPRNANKTKAIIAIVSDGLEGLQQTLQVFSVFEVMKNTTLSAKDAQSEEWKDALDALGVPEEARKKKLDLSKHISLTKMVSEILPVAIREVPDSIFKAVAVMLISNEAWSYAFMCGEKAQKDCLLKSEARVRFGTEKNDWVGMSTEELLEAAGVAVEIYKEELEAAVPLALDLGKKLGVIQSEPPENETGTKTTTEASSSNSTPSPEPTDGETETTSPISGQTSLEI